MSEKIVVPVSVPVSVEGMENAVNTIRNGLSKGKFGEGLSSSITSSLDKASEKIGDIKARLGKGEMSIVDRKQVEKDMAAIENEYVSLIRKIERINPESTFSKEDAKAINTMIKGIEQYGNAARKSAKSQEDLNKKIQETKQKIEEVKRGSGKKVVTDAEYKTSEVRKSNASRAARTTDKKLKEAQANYDARLRKDYGGVETEESKKTKEAEALNTALKKSLKAQKDLNKATEELNGITTSSNITKEVKSLDNELAKAQKDLQNLKATGKTAQLEGIDKTVKSLKEIDGIDWSKMDVDLDNIKSIDDLSSALDKLRSGNIAQTTDAVKTMSTGMEELNINSNKSAEAFHQFGASLDDATSRSKELDAFKQRILDVFSITSTVQIFKRLIRDAVNTVKELDKAMTETAVVTDFSVGDMWSQLPEYSKRAEQLGATIHDVYAATTLYYQQGLTTRQAVALSNETLKMARIAGLDAAEATDRMTNALRGFNMELTEASAQKVNDVYSKLAAISASNVDEISTAMTKVASLASNANMEFETTSALLSQIIETTREAPETAGTALKTVIARFSEVKKLYGQGALSGTDEEGEAIEVNKVATALKSAGINMNEFFTGAKGLDDIFLELSSKWDTLSTVQQRYIATTAAGSRQQSRFIAMMSDNARLTDLVAQANGAAGASQEQYNKTLDSLEAKMNQLKDSWDLFVMGLANSDAIKMVVDGLKGLLNLLNSLSSSFTGLGGSLTKAFVAFKIFGTLKAMFSKIFGMLKKESFLGGQQIGREFQRGMETGARTGSGIQSATASKFSAFKAKAINGFRNGINKIAGSKTVVAPSAEGTEQSTSAINANTNALGENTKTAAINVDTQKQWEAQAAANVKSASHLSNGLLALGVALSGISSTLKENGQEETAEYFDIFANGLTTASMGVMVLSSALTALGISLSIGPLAVVTAIIAAVTVAVGWINKLNEDAKKNSIENRIKNLQNATSELQESAKAAEDRYTSLYKRIADTKNAQKALDGLRKGSEEYREAVMKNNQEVLEAIKNDKELGKFLKSRNGILSIDVDDPKYQDYLDKTYEQSLRLRQSSYGTDYRQHELTLEKYRKDRYDGVNSARGTSIFGDLGYGQKLSTDAAMTFGDLLEKSVSQIIKTGDIKELIGNSVKNDIQASGGQGAKEKVEKETIKGIVAAINHMLEQQGDGKAPIVIENESSEDLIKEITDKINSGELNATVSDLLITINEEKMQMEALTKAMIDNSIELAKNSNAFRNEESAVFMGKMVDYGVGSSVKKNADTTYNNIFKDEDGKTVDWSKIKGGDNEETVKNFLRSVYGVDANGFRDFSFGDDGKVYVKKDPNGGNEEDNLQLLDFKDETVQAQLKAYLEGEDMTNFIKDVNEIIDETDSATAAWNKFTGAQKKYYENDIEKFSKAYKEGMKARVEYGNNTIMSATINKATDAGVEQKNIDAGSTLLKFNNKKISDSMSQTVSAANATMSLGVDNLVDKYKEWKELIGKSGQIRLTSTEDAVVFNELQSTIKKMLNLSQNLSTSFWKEEKNIKALKKIAKKPSESAKAWQRLQKQATIDIFKNTDFLKGKQTNDEVKKGVKNAKDTLVKELKKIKIPKLELGVKWRGAEFKEFKNKFNELARAANMSAEEIQNAVQSMGFSAEVEYVHQERWMTPMNHIMEPIDDNGSYTESIVPGEPVKQEGWFPVIKTLTSSGSGGGGVSVSNTGAKTKNHKSSTKKGRQKNGWNNPYTKLDNINNTINASIQKRNHLEAEYNKLLNKNVVSSKKLGENIEQQYQSLLKERGMNKAKIGIAESNIRNAGQKTFAVGKGKRMSAEQLGLTDLIRYDSKQRKVIYNIKGLKYAEENSKYSKYGQIVEKYGKFLEKQSQNLDEARSSIDEINESIRNLKNEVLQKRVDLQTQVKDAIETHRENVVNAVQSAADAIVDATNEAIDKTSDLIDKERKAREKDKQKQDLNNKIARMNTLKNSSSGADQLEAMKLQKEIEQETLDYTDSLVDDAIQQMRDDAAEAQKQREKQINLMKARNEQDKKTGKFAEEALKLIDGAVDANGNVDKSSTLVKLMKNNTGWSSMTKDERTSYWKELKQNIGQGTQQVNIQAITDSALDMVKKRNNKKDVTVSGSMSAKQYEKAPKTTIDGKKYVKTSKGWILRSDIKQGADGKYSWKNAQVYKKSDTTSKYQDSVTSDLSQIKKGINKVDKIQGEIKKAADKISKAVKDAAKNIGNDKDNGKKKNKKGKKKNDNTTSESHGITYDGKTKVKVKKEDGQKYGSNTEYFGYTTAKMGGKTYYVKNSNVTPNGDGIVKGASLYESKEEAKIAVLEDMFSRDNETKKFLADAYYDDLIDTIGSFSKIEFLGKKFWVRTKELGKNGTVKKGTKYIESTGSNSAAGTVAFKTGGLADFTGPAWLDGTKTRPEIVLNQQDSKNFLLLKDALSSLAKGNTLNSTSSGDNYYTINIQAEIGSDYDVDKLTTKIKKEIYNDSMYRNVNVINRIR